MLYTFLNYKNLIGLKIFTINISLTPQFLVNAKQWESPTDISIIICCIKSSTTAGEKSVISDDPHPRFDPCPHVNT